MKLYRTLFEESYSEQIIEKSKFICHIASVSNREEADKYILDIRKKYKDATHNVPCFILGNKMEVKWQSDDSEPQGTAGAPILDLLEKEKITNVVCVVTRYFGGIKLGTGGLVRAYQSTAKLALINAKICDVLEYSILTYEVDYNTYQKIEKIREKEFDILDKSFGSNVQIKFGIVVENVDALKNLISNISNGRAKLIDSKVENFKKII